MGGSQLLLRDGGARPTPGRWAKCRVGPGHGAGAERERCFSETWGQGSGRRCRNKNFLPSLSPVQAGAGIPPVGAPGGLVLAWQLVVRSSPHCNDP